MEKILLFQGFIISSVGDALTGLHGPKSAPLGCAVDENFFLSYLEHTTIFFEFCHIQSEWFELGGTLKGPLVHPLCREQGHTQLDWVAQSPSGLTLDISKDEASSFLWCCHPHWSSPLAATVLCLVLAVG